MGALAVRVNRSARGRRCFRNELIMACRFGLNDAPFSLVRLTALGGLLVVGWKRKNSFE
jgi:hypothetical protein